MKDDPKPEMPDAPGFWILSSGCRDAGDTLLARIRRGEYVGHMVMSCVFEYFRCIELALKSVLISNGVPEREIASRALGHDLSALIQRAEEFIAPASIGISPKGRAMIDHFSKFYSNKYFEYASNWWNTPDLEELQQLSREICEGAKRNAQGKWRLPRELRP